MQCLTVLRQDWSYKYITVIKKNQMVSMKSKCNWTLFSIFRTGKFTGLGAMNGYSISHLPRVYLKDKLFIHQLIMPLDLVMNIPIILLPYPIKLHWHNEEILYSGILRSSFMHLISIHILISIRNDIATYSFSFH